MNPCDFRILVCGCFDVFHVGHLQLLRGASRFGNVYVRIGDDESVRLKKGETRPIVPAEARLDILRACRYVFNAEIFSFTANPITAHEELVKAVKPDAYAEGRDHNNTAIYPILKEYGIPRIIIPGDLQSTSSLLPTQSQDPNNPENYWRDEPDEINENTCTNRN